MKRKTSKKLGQILIDNALIDEKQFEEALEFQKVKGGLLGEILVKMGYVNEIEIVKALTVQYGFPYIPLENYDFKSDIGGELPEPVARQYGIVPVDTMGNILTIAMSNPLNEKAIEDVEMVTGKTVQVFISTVTAVTEALEKIY